MCNDRRQRGLIGGVSVSLCATVRKVRDAFLVLRTVLLPVNQQRNLAIQGLASGSRAIIPFRYCRDGLAVDVAHAGAANNFRVDCLTFFSNLKSDCGSVLIGFTWLEFKWSGEKRSVFSTNWYASGERFFLRSGLRPTASGQRNQKQQDKKMIHLATVLDTNQLNLATPRAKCLGRELVRSPQLSYALDNLLGGGIGGCVVGPSSVA